MFESIFNVFKHVFSCIWTLILFEHKNIICIMKKICFCLLMLCLVSAGEVFAEQLVVREISMQYFNGEYCHPWQGKRVAYLGDSITDPNVGKNEIKHYWEFLHDWLNTTSYVYAVSGKRWNDIPRQASELFKQHGDNVDAIIIFIGTNDYMSGVPIGSWYNESKEKVMAAVGHEKGLLTRKKRTLIMNNNTYKGCINVALDTLKKLFPTKQIILLTPLHRAYAKFSDRNIQPDERYANKCGEYISAYVNAIKESANIWSVPVIDLNAISGINPMVDGQISYFHNYQTDRLHPNTKGHLRIACTLFYQLLTVPCTFNE